MIKLHCFEQDKLKVKVSLSICHCHSKLNIAKYLLLFIFMNFIVPLSYSRCPILAFCENSKLSTAETSIINKKY